MVKLSALALAALTLTACMEDDKHDNDNQAEMDTKLEQAAQIGQAQAIAQIIERTMAEPCQPINLFNNIDENNRKEVNLINVACESLDLPEIPAAEAEAETEATETTE